MYNPEPWISGGGSKPNWFAPISTISRIDNHVDDKTKYKSTIYLKDGSTVPCKDNPQEIYHWMIMQVAAFKLPDIDRMLKETAAQLKIEQKENQVLKDKVELLTAEILALRAIKA